MTADESGSLAFGWFSFVQLANGNGSALDSNATIDVVNKGCFGSFNTVACVRNGFLASLIAVTLVLCISRIVRLHVVKHPQVHQFVVFYLASVECVICGVNWGMGSHRPQLDFTAAYLKWLQFTVVCHLHWTLATRILHKEKLVKRVIVPILALCFAYFTTMTVLGIYSVKSSWIECLAPDWILLSFVEFLVVQLFMIAGIYITKKINAVSTVESFKRAQKRDLWSVIAAYEVSALVSVVYDLTMLILGSEAQSCSGIFGHMQLVYSPIFALFMILKLMLPIWVMLCVFHPVPIMIVDPETVLRWSFEGPVPTSVFSPAHRERHIYKPLQHPAMNTGQSGDASGAVTVRPSAPPAAAVATHTQPSPGFMGTLKRGGQASVLEPIREENETIVVVMTQPTPCPDKPGESGGAARGDVQLILNSDSSRTTETSSISD